jgi:hypothetical protein
LYLIILIMKRSFIIIIGILLITNYAAAQSFRYTEASELTLTGKLFTDTPNPYHRLDTVRYKGFTKGENRQVRESSGIAVAFSTDSRSIRIKTEFGEREQPYNTMGISAFGYDLYILRDGRWYWAGSGPRGSKKYDDFTIVENMDGTEHQCLLYLPTFSEEKSVLIGVESGSSLTAIPNPFRWRIGVYGSSFTHGTSTSRSGMTYPAQFSRNTGIQLLSLGCSGNCKMQPYFARALEDASVDGFLFDTFSNPTEEEIRERLFPFIERMVRSHPGKPIIFQSTIYRGNRGFNTASARKEESRAALVDSLMSVACARYADVYYIHPYAGSQDDDTFVDGIHPGNDGYTKWAESIQAPVLAILRKYGIK